MRTRTRPTFTKKHPSTPAAVAINIIFSDFVKMNDNYCSFHDETMTPAAREFVFYIFIYVKLCSCDLCQSKKRIPDEVVQSFTFTLLTYLDI